ncbi:putative bifunctional diguanylate cyclase/phosphodiesterase, partial [Rhodopseudomonas palustris]
MTDAANPSIDLDGRSLRKTVKAVALVVALAITLFAPVGYGLIGYQIESMRATFRAQLSANRLARYIYRSPEMWHYQRVRLREIIELAEAPFKLGRNRILDKDGKVILVEGNSALDSHFLLTRSFPIVVAGEAVGSVEFDVPLDPLLRRIGIFALFSLLLGACTYLAVRILPLRALDRTLRDLDRANATIRERNAELQTQNDALNEREQALRATKASLRHRSDQLVEAQLVGKIGDWSYRLGDSQVHWAPEIYGLLGYDPSFGSSHAAVMSLYVGDGARRVLEAQAEVIRTGQVRTVDVKGRRGDGSIMDCAVTSKAMRDAEGRVIGFHGTIQDISERKRAEEQLEQLAYYDPLTGLANRALFHRQINDVLQRRGRNDTEAALLLLDLDRFKEVNDSLGHAAGDELLAKAAHLISRVLDSSHFLSRLGGDEFAIILTACADRSTAEAIANAVVGALSGAIQLERGEVNVSTSVGIAMIPGDGANVHDLLRNADLALYRAKEDGRGRLQFFEAGMSEVVQHKIALSRDLRRAVNENNGLFVHYQPQVEVLTGRVCGFEALMRWAHPTRGDVEPSEFIPIAESSHLICDLGLWILREAARQAKAWIEAGETPRQISVNVSAAQIWHTDFVGDVMRVLAETGLAPHLLCLELTESLLADHAEGRVRRVLTELNQLG